MAQIEVTIKQQGKPVVVHAVTEATTCCYEKRLFEKELVVVAQQQLFATACVCSIITVLYFLVSTGSGLWSIVG